MDATAALDDLLALSTQVGRVVVLGSAGETIAATDGAEPLAGAAAEALAAAAELRPGGEVERVEVRLPDGGLVLVRDGTHTVAATTVAGATPALVLYDLRTCLRRLRGGGEGAGDGA